MKLGVYFFSGLSAGIAALIALGYYGSASSGDGSGDVLNVIAAAVVGGASLTGGRGSAARSDTLIPDGTRLPPGPIHAARAQGRRTLTEVEARDTVSGAPGD